MHRHKIETALSSALRHLEDSMRALLNNNEKAVSDSVWSASAEAEYAVFLFSFMQGDRSENASWKHGSTSKQSIELKPALTSAQELLENAKARLEEGSFEKAYEETWTARNLLLKAQEWLEKKRKEAKQ